jgi:hypothetical protein
MSALPWSQALREGTVAGTAAGLLSSVVLAAVGKRQAGSMAAPVNAASHWLWGDRALHEDRATVRHTGLGLLTQHAAAIFWAALYAALYGHRAEAKRLPDAIAGGIATSAAAYLIDYTITPKRFTPGYEHRLDGKGMLAVYGALAVGFALGAYALGHMRSGKLIR